MPRRARAAQPVEEVEEVFEEVDELEDPEEDDLEELEEEEVVEEKPARRARKAAPAKAAPATKKAESTGTVYDSVWLANYINEETEFETDSRGVRMVLRRLAKDGDLDRAVGEDRSRYSFRGPNDPTVKAVLRFYRTGKASAMKQENIKSMQTRVTKKAAPAAPAKKTAAKKAAPVPKATPATRRRRAAATAE